MGGGRWEIEVASHPMRSHENKRHSIRNMVNDIITTT